MASLYTDEVREQRFIVNRKRKKLLDRLYDVLMFVALIYGLSKMITMAFDSLTNGIMLGSMLSMLSIFLFVPGATATIYTLSLKTVKSAVIAELITIACFLLSGDATDLYPYLLIGLGSIILAKCWEKLAEEEGFPLFDISYREMEERRNHNEKRTRYQATLLGERERRIRAEEVAAVWNDAVQQHIVEGSTTKPQKEEMSDLLDIGRDAPIEKQNLEQYHDRSREDLRETLKLDEETQKVMRDVVDFQPNQTSQMH